MSKKPYLSVIVPSYNEKKNLSRGALDELVNFLKKQDYSWELILSDDGSTDGTIEALHKFAKEHPHTEVVENVHAGKGPTVKAGMLVAHGEWRLFTDFDQSTSISEITKLLRYTKEYDVIFGSREMIGAQRDKEPFYRHLMGRGFNLMVQTLAVPGMLDTQCGFKLFSEEATRKLFHSLKIYGDANLRSDAYTGAFDVELLYLANKFKFKIREVPIEWKHHETNRVSPIKDSLRMLRDIIRIRIADIRKKYD